MGYVLLAGLPRLASVGEKASQRVEAPVCVCVCVYPGGPYQLRREEERGWGKDCVCVCDREGGSEWDVK